LVAEYCEKYANTGFVLGDIRKYLTEDLTLPQISDPGVRAFLTNVFDSEVTDPRTAIIFSQFCLVQFADTNDFSLIDAAIDKCEQFRENRSVLVMLLRLKGIRGETRDQMAVWEELRLEGILYLSLGSMALPDFLRQADFKALGSISDATHDFVRMAGQNFMRYFQIGINIFNVTQVRDCLKLKHDVAVNLIAYFTFVFRFWFNAEAVDDLDGEGLQPNEVVRGYSSRTDRSIIELYFRDPRLAELMFPDMTNWTLLFNGLAHLFVALKLKQKERIAPLCAEIVELGLGDGWQNVVGFARTKQIAADAPLNPLMLITLKTLARVHGVAVPVPFREAVDGLREAQQLLREPAPVEIP
jgi:hypothetical protein